MNPSVDWFFAKEGKWKEAYAALRAMILQTNLVEELKWGCPCYTLNKKNVVVIHGFKDYCALLFMKGVLLKDEPGLLIQQTANVQDRRQIRFTSLQQIMQQEEAIAAYLKDAIEIEKAGLKVVLKQTAEFNMPEEFSQLLNEMPNLKKAFEALTPGRQRGYLLYFDGAKQAKTREARIEKYVSKILDGKGLDD
eukprot:Opistho-1_new@81038